MFASWLVDLNLIVAVASIWVVCLDCLIWVYSGCTCLGAVWFIGFVVLLVVWV